MEIWAWRIIMGLIGLFDAILIYWIIVIIYVNKFGTSKND